MTYLKDQKLKEIELPRRWNNRKWADTVFIRYQETTKQNDNLKRNVPLIIVQIKPYFSHKHSSTVEGSEGKKLKRVSFCMFCRKPSQWKKWTFRHFRKTFKTCYHCLSLIIGRLYLFDWNLPPMWLSRTLLGLLEVCLPFYPSFPCFCTSKDSLLSTSCCHCNLRQRNSILLALIWRMKPPEDHYTQNLPFSHVHLRCGEAVLVFRFVQDCSLVKGILKYLNISVQLWNH